MKELHWPYSFREKNENECAGSASSAAMPYRRPESPVLPIHHSPFPIRFAFGFKNCPLSTHLVMKEPYWPYSFREKNENECAGSASSAAMPPRRSRSIPVGHESPRFSAGSAFAIAQHPRSGTEGKHAAMPRVLALFVRIPAIAKHPRGTQVAGASHSPTHSP